MYKTNLKYLIFNKNVLNYFFCNQKEKKIHLCAILQFYWSKVCRIVVDMMSVKECRKKSHYKHLKMVQTPSKYLR